MSVEWPSPWAQAYPRSVRLAPDGLLVPAATLRLHLSRGRPLDLLYTGHALEPCIADGQVLRVEPAAAPRPGDLVLCEQDGWADVRRVLRRQPGGDLLTALDPVAGARATLPAVRLLGTVRGARGCGGLPGAAIALGFPIWSRLAALLHWRRTIVTAPCFGDAAADSVRRKYEQQAEGYTERLGPPMDPRGIDLLVSRLPSGGSVLIAGSGAGGEVLHLARRGYRVTGFDFAPRMVAASRDNARRAGLEVELLQADLGDLDLGERRFDAAYITPLVHSFIAGRQRRVEALRRLGRHLARGGPLIFTAYLIRDPASLIAALLAWIRGRREGGEFGDWYTRYMTPRGAIGTSYIHRGFTQSVRGEAREAGFARVERAHSSHFIASEFASAG